jgi:hypothetical protein
MSKNVDTIRLFRINPTHDRTGNRCPASFSTIRRRSCATAAARARTAVLGMPTATLYDPACGADESASNSNNNARTRSLATNVMKKRSE